MALRFFAANPLFFPNASVKGTSLVRISTTAISLALGPTAPFSNHTLSTLNYSVLPVAVSYTDDIRGWLPGCFGDAHGSAF